MKTSAKLLITIVFTILLLAPFLKVFAEDSTESVTPSIKTGRVGNSLSSMEKRADKRASREAEIKNKLSTARLNVCKAREKIIVHRSKIISDKAQRLNGRWVKITETVQKYYLNKLVPQGLVLDNYDSLISDIAAKKAIAVSLMEKAASDSAEFRCDSDDPSGLLQLYREDMSDVREALKNYRLSVRTFILAVRGLNKEKNEGAETVEPTGGAL